jgi:glutamate racemase
MLDGDWSSDVCSSDLVDVRIVPCPGWATRVETLHLDDPEFAGEIETKVLPLLDAGVDRIVLGCTHYAFLKPLMEPLARGRAELIDVADAVARQVLRLGGERTEKSHLRLLATARPDRLRAALPSLGLGWLAERTHGPAQLASV